MARCRVICLQPAPSLKSPRQGDGFECKLFPRPDGGHPEVWAPWKSAGSIWKPGSRWPDQVRKEKPEHHLQNSLSHCGTIISPSHSSWLFGSNHRLFLCLVNHHTQSMFPEYSINSFSPPPPCMPHFSIRSSSPLTWTVAVSVYLISWPPVIVSVNAHLTM